MIVVLASQDSFPCGPKGRFRFWRRGAAIPPALGSRVSRTLTKRAGGSGRATDSQFRCSGSRSQDRLSRACWPACVPSDPWTLGFPTQDLSRAPRPSSLLFLCPSYSNSKAQFLEIELIFGRRLARDFQHKLQNSGRKRVKRPGNSAHRSEDDLHERAGREPRNGRRKGSRGHDPAG